MNCFWGIVDPLKKQNIRQSVEQCFWCVHAYPQTYTKYSCGIGQIKTPMLLFLLHKIGLEKQDKWMQKENSTED